MSLRLARWLPLGLLAPLAAIAMPPEKTGSPELAPPVRIEAAGKPIDTAVGHAAPFVGDFDGDGVKRSARRPVRRRHPLDLPQRGHQRRSPKLAAGVKFKDGGKDGRVPTG